MHSCAHAFLTHPLAVNNKFATFTIFQFLAPKNYWGPSPHLGMALETPFSALLFSKSFMKIRSAVPENGCLIFMHFVVADGKKAKKRTVKHIRICAT